MKSLFGDSRGRAAFERFAPLFTDQNGKMPFTVAESALRRELVITASANSFIFNFAATNGPLRPLETGLNQNDAFVMTRLGLYVDVRDVTKPSAVALQSFPAKQLGAHGATANDFATFFNTVYSQKVNNILTVPSSRTEKFLSLPINQDIITAYNGAANVSSGAYVASNYLVEIDPFQILAGGSTNELSVVINNTGLTLASSAGYESVLTVIAEGFLVTGGSDWYLSKQAGQQA